MSTLKTGKVKTTTIADELDTESTAVTNVINGSAKAWINFNGTGTVAIRRSFNVTSITDLAVGKYTVNFTNDMPDVNYARVASMGMSGGFYANAFDDIHSPTTSGFTIGVRSGATYYDIAFIHASVFS